MDATDRALLDVIQRGFPLSPRPFDEIAACLSLTGEEVISRISRLKSAGIIRQISAIFDSAALGYHGALVAFAVEQGQLDAAAKLVAAHAGVSHCYSRDSGYNLWFTLTLPPELDTDTEARGLAAAAGVTGYMVLPAIRVYKIGVFLAMGDAPTPAWPNAASPTSPVALSEQDRAAVRALQTDIPLVENPFEPLAAAEGLTESDLLSRAKAMLANGAMRRYAAVLKHHAAGYRANAMVCWNVSPDRIDEVGGRFAELQWVSHCYQRPTFADWPYPLYTMVHCRDSEELERAVAELARLSGTQEYLVLRSLREYKKSRVTYFRP